MAFLVNTQAQNTLFINYGNIIINSKLIAIVAQISAYKYNSNKNCTNLSLALIVYATAEISTVDISFFLNHVSSKDLIPEQSKRKVIKQKMPAL